MKTNPSVYLAGYVKETEYRQYSKDKYGKEIDFFDPISEFEDNFLLPIEESFDIVTKEKYQIEQSNILVAYIKRKTIGTTMEIMHAFNNGIPVFVIVEDEAFKSDLWLAYHTTRFFNSIDDCMQYIIHTSNTEG